MRRPTNAVVAHRAESRCVPMVRVECFFAFAARKQTWKRMHDGYIGLGRSGSNALQKIGPLFCLEWVPPRRRPRSDSGQVVRSRGS